MEVILLIGLAATLAVCSIYLYQSNKTIKEEASSLGEILNQTLLDSEQALNDHKDAERQLAIAHAKLETSLTPENSVPKEVYQSKVFELSQELQATQLMLKDTTKKFEESRGKQISERVRLGQVAENFSCFFEEFPYNRKETKALFQPVDLICFEEDEVIFIDVKTGNAKLSSKQRKIRDNIKAGRVRFEVHRLDENGYNVEKK